MKSNQGKKKEPLKALFLIMVGPDASVVSESTSYTNEVCADCVENQALLRFSSKPEETQSRAHKLFASLRALQFGSALGVTGNKKEPLLGSL